MATRAGRSDPGFYPERQPGREAFLDRALGELGYAAHSALRRRLAPAGALAAQVAAHVGRLRAAGPLMESARELRYRLRRDGLERERLAECFALYAATQGAGGPAPGGEALAAAAALVEGRVVDGADAANRRTAIALAATAFALCGVPVHLYAASLARARATADALRAPLGMLGASVECVHPGLGAAERRVAYGASVVCGTQRVIAFDYLRDRIRLGRRLRPMQSRLERLSGDTTASGMQLLLHGLHCALVEDADLVLLDDARAPMVISADVESSADRMPYEQALELARALDAEDDFALDGEGHASLSPHGARRLEELSTMLGGMWSARQWREDLVAAALTALHGMARGQHYEVEQGILRLAPSGEDEEPAPSEALQRLLEIKERLAFAGRREVLARLPVPRFFRRYLRLAGVCADARGLEREFWSLYGLHSARAGPSPPRASCALRVFVTPDLRREALAESVRAHTARGEAVLIVTRAPEEAAALEARLKAGGLAVATAAMRADGEASTPQALAELERPGGVVICVPPAHRDVARPADAAVPVHLAVAELQDSARHVGQLADACRASSCEQFLALEDETLAVLLGERANAARGAAGGDGELAAAAAEQVLASAQAAAEQTMARVRHEMMRREQTIEDLLAFSGRPE
jgi:preprotein translocase subunit SecA